jgi:tyrosine decarboxylase/aspartate 1-decarboxylase
MLEKQSLEILREAVDKLEEGFADLPDFAEQVDMRRLREVLLQTAEKMQNNYPYHHPFYIGQMLKPPHPVARLAYMLSMWINPNNHALDGSRASSPMEKESVSQIAAMFGWDTHLGHLTSGGTVANMEALWISGRLHPEKKIAASKQAHYTHSRITEVLKIPFVSVPTDKYARMDVAALKQILDENDIGTVVVTIGTTATGSVDPLPAILDLQQHYGFRIHVDSAYGGYFTLADNLADDARRAYDAIMQADSIVIDPHKHGLQPYGCGCVIFKDPSVGRFYKHDSPYTYFTSDELHLGEISLECSRAGSTAVGLWTTQQMFPLVRDGEFAQSLQTNRTTTLEFYQRLNADARFMTVFEPELDIIIWSLRGKSASEISQLSRAVFNKGAELGLHLALTTQPRNLLEQWWTDIEWDAEAVTMLRACFMKPEHLEWLDAIFDTLVKATDSCLEHAQ